MFCGKCGNQIDDNAAFCPSCGNPVAPKSNTVNTNSYNNSTNNNFTSPMPPQPPKKNGKKIALIVTIAILVIASIVTTLCLILSSNGGGSTSNYRKDRASKNNNDNDSSEGYVDEVEDYLNFIKNKEDDADKYIEDTYFGGAFGYYYSGKDADNAHKLEAKSNFEDTMENTMDYGYAEYYDCDTWEEYVEESDIEEFYNSMSDCYGDWDMTYKITDTKKCSNEKLDSLKDIWEECIEEYDYFSESASFESDDQREYDSFIDSIRDLKVSEAYSVEVKIEFDGDEDSYDNVWSFSVAKIGKEWVILEGPSFYEFYENL